ncbi:MAG: VWA domain-containing protein [Roseiflexus sp.]|nr:VWA domain-containing protein [Roseiflexus sp.]MCS7288171.1 VWA domain-containing protein [Roseiflexus sp.]MDW8145979.1 VWA domain-containing protein [Roseiflexaceae bacterium]MDW8232994.1 VWA domain-containing protein [Roseiflexaceae bacterium]
MTAGQPESERHNRDASDALPPSAHAATETGAASGGDKTQGGKTFMSDPTFRPPKIEGARDRLQRRAPGRRSRTRTTRKQGRYITSRPAERITDLALDATLRQAAPHQRRRRMECSDDQLGRRIIIRRSDLRQKVRVRKTRNAVCFVVDASWSMAAEERMRATKAAVLSLLRDAYQRRDRVGLVSFQRDYATLLLPLTNSVELAQRRLQQMPTGGKTPLSRGLLLGYEVLERARRQDPEVMPLLVVLTDGQANVSMSDLPPQAESYALADFIASQSIPAVVIDTEHPIFERGLARQLAYHLKGSYYRLEDVQERGLADLVRAELRDRTR